MHRAFRFTPLGLAVASVAACGGGGASSPETWAQSFCATLANLQNGLEPVVRTVDDQRSRGAAGKQELLQALRAGRLVIRDAAADLHALRRPESDYARRTQGLVDSYAYGLDDYATDLDSVERAVVRLPPEKYQLQKNGWALRLGLKLAVPLSLSSEVLSELREVPPGRLRDALDREAACRQVREDA